MARLLFRLGSGAHRHRLAVVLVWVLVLIGAGVGSATLAGSTTSSFNIPGQESTTALDLIDREFGSGAGGATAQVVVKAPAGQTLTDGPAAAEVAALVKTLNGLPGVASATNPLDPARPTVSPDRSTGYSTVTYTAEAGAVTEAQQEALTDALADARGTGLTVEAAGEATQSTETGGGSIGEAAGVVVALVVLAITYGALAIAGMNLLTALIGVGVGFLGIQIATGFLELSATTPALATMLGLAVGIDYALFIVTRFRQELRRGMPVGSAVGIATGTAGSAVVTAGVTVVIALVGLFVTGIPFLTQMGIAAAGTIVVAVLIAITLVPAVLSLLGTRALPRKQRKALAAAQPEGGRHEAPVEQQVAPAREGRGFFSGWIGGVVRHRTVTLLAAVVALAVVAIPLFSMRTTLIQTPAEGSTQARAEQLLTDAFGAGFNGPITVFFDGDGAVQAATAAKPELARLDDVATVTDPVPNQAGDAALLTVVPKSGPTTAATEDLVAAMRSTLADVDGARPYVTGSTAVSVDVAKTLNDALPVYLVLVVGLAFVLLVLVFRSLLVPLVGVLGFLLTIGASLGATVAVFQWGRLDSLLGVDVNAPLLSLAPILVIGILFGLAMDYQVFLVSRMHEAHGHGADNRTAITTGFGQAAPVVVAAATIMFSVFAGFFTGGDSTIKQIAFALAAGILFDAFVVRMVLVPAAMALLGERSWWLPRWLRWLPELDVEGTAIEREVPAPAAAEPVGAGTR